MKPRTAQTAHFPGKNQDPSSKQERSMDTGGSQHHLPRQEGGARAHPVSPAACAGGSDTPPLRPAAPRGICCHPLPPFLTEGTDVREVKELVTSHLSDRPDAEPAPIPLTSTLERPVLPAGGPPRERGNAVSHQKLPGLAVSLDDFGKEGRCRFVRQDTC